MDINKLKTKLLEEIGDDTDTLQVLHRELITSYVCNCILGKKSPELLKLIGNLESIIIEKNLSDEGGLNSENHYLEMTCTEGMGAYQKAGIGDFATAEKLVEIALKKKKTDIYALFALGLILCFKDKKYDLSHLAYSKLIENTPKDWSHRAMVLNNDAISLFSMGRAQEALSKLEESIKLKEWFGPYYNRGQYYLTQRKIQAAKKDLKKTLELKPDYEPASFLLDQIKDE